MRSLFFTIVLSCTSINIIAQDYTGMKAEWSVKAKKCQGDSVEMLFTSRIPDNWMLATQNDPDLGFRVSLKSPKKKSFLKDELILSKGEIFRHRELKREMVKGTVEFRAKFKIDKRIKEIRIKGTIDYWIVQDRIAIPPIEQVFSIVVD